MKPHPLAAGVAGPFAFTASITPWSAQSAPPTVPLKEEKDAVVQLSPFEVVDAKKGYYAPNTGVPSSYRIVSPRQFILQASFDV